jgi:hypothetical protein
MGPASPAPRFAGDRILSSDASNQVACQTPPCPLLPVSWTGALAQLPATRWRREGAGRSRRASPGRTPVNCGCVSGLAACWSPVQGSFHEPTLHETTGVGLAMRSETGRIAVSFCRLTSSGCLRRRRRSAADQPPPDLPPADDGPSKKKSGPKRPWFNRDASSYLTGGGYQSGGSSSQGPSVICMVDRGL